MVQAQLEYSISSLTILNCMVFYSDLVGCIKDKKRKMGYVFTISVGTISWSLKKWPFTTLSSLKSKYVAVTATSYQTV